MGESERQCPNYHAEPASAACTNTERESRVTGSSNDRREFVATKSGVANGDPTECMREPEPNEMSAGRTQQVTEHGCSWQLRVIAPQDGRRLTNRVDQ